MEISPDIFIQITKLGHCRLIMGQFIVHSLNTKHLLVIGFLQQIHLETAHYKRQPCDFLLPVYKNYKSGWQSGTNSGTKAQTETPYQKKCAHFILQNSNQLLVSENLLLVHLFRKLSSRHLFYSYLPHYNALNEKH